MTRYSRRMATVVLILLCPGAVAAVPADQGSDVRTYETHVVEADSTTDSGTLTATFTFTTPHDLTVLERNSWFSIDANYLLEGGIGNRITEFTFESDGDHQCSWRVAIGSNLQSLNAYRHTKCSDSAIEPGQHTVWINATAISGSDPVVWAGYSITLQQRETVTTMTTFESLTGLTAAEFAIFPALAFLGVILWSRSNDVGVRVVGAVLPLVAAALLISFGSTIGFGVIWNGTIALAVILGTIGAYLLVRVFIEYFTERAA